MDLSRYAAHLTERDLELYPRNGYGARMGFGRRPVILVIDVSYGFTGHEPEPILDAVERWPNSCGEEAWAAVERTVELLQAARDKRIPVIYSTGVDAPIAGDFGLGRWLDKLSREAEDQTPDANVIVAPIAPRPEDIVIEKHKPSAFFGTMLEGYLAQLEADSVITCGVATSGCVRATVVDGFSFNRRMIVVEECTFDRGQATHWINLFDMDMKYADVVTLEQTLAHLDSLEPGLFDAQMPVLAPTSA
jgi:nicotinamidase-related amidase